MLTTRARADTALARSALYTFLSNGFAYPSAPRRSLLVDAMAPGLREIEGMDAGLADALAACLDRLPRDLVSFERAHRRQFPLIESRDCPAYETAYRGRDVFGQAHVMADVAGAYRAHGLRMGGIERERPDHVTVELEFMSFLTAKQAYALDRLSSDESDVCEATQRLFLGAHLGTWGPGFGRRVEATATDGFYRRLGGLLAIWLDADMDHVGVEPVEVADRPLPPPPPDDGACAVGEASVWPLRLGERPR